jgi:thiazole/oxazole-forming peptide maturase SagC family component
MHAAVDGPFVLVGPIFVPNRSACYNCFEVRVMMNLREAGSYQRYKHALVKGQIKRGGDPLLPLLGNLLTAHTAMEIVNFELTGTSWTVGKVLSIYLPTMEMIFNDVLRLPGCPACAPTPERDDTELYFDIRATADH